MQERRHFRDARFLRDDVAAFEKVELDDRGTANRHGTSGLDEQTGGDERAAGGEQVVDDENALAGLDGVALNLDGVWAVFLLVRLAERVAGQFARLAQRHEADAERECNDGTEDEAARFETSDSVDLLCAKVSGQRVAHELEGRRVAEQRCDVEKVDAFELTRRNQSFDASDIVGTERHLLGQMWRGFVNSFGFHTMSFVADDSDLTKEELEERRLLRSIAGASKAKAFSITPSASTSNSSAASLASPRTATAAPAPTSSSSSSTQSPRDSNASVPVWKQRQLEAEAATRARLEAEAAAKQAQLKKSVHTAAAGDVDSAGMLSPRAGADEVQRERVLVDYLHGKTGATDEVQRAADAERERLETIFKAKPGVNKKRFEPIAKEAQERMAEAEKEREAEHAKREAAADAAEQRRAALIAERARAAVATLRAAERHYDGPDAKTEHLNELERGVVAEIAALRADPAAYKKKLLDRRMRYDGNVLTLADPDGPTVHLKTSEGVAAVDAAIKALDLASPAPIAHEKAVTRAMFTAVRKAPNAKPNAVADIANYGAVSGTARQLMYRGPVIDAADVVISLLVDDGEPQRTRRDALLADKFKHFGVAAACDESGKFNYCFILLLSNFAEKA